MVIHAAVGITWLMVYIPNGQCLWSPSRSRKEREKKNYMERQESKRKSVEGVFGALQVSITSGSTFGSVALLNLIASGDTINFIYLFICLIVVIIMITI